MDLVELQYAKKLLTPRSNTAEKHDFGHVLVAGGSYGMTGAILLAAKACLRSGAGLTTLLSPVCSHVILQTAVPEAMLLPVNDQFHLHTLPDVDRFRVIACGPGLGRHKETVNFIENLLLLRRPLLLDADALNIIAEFRWQRQIPPGSILTPHLREFERLFGVSTKDRERLAIQLEQAKRLQCYILLKGHQSVITYPDGNVFRNSSGNPALAKGGSGDVLTGITAGLWARLEDAGKAIVLGVFLHGLAADLAVKQIHEESLIASDLITFLPQAFSKIS